MQKNINDSNIIHCHSLTESNSDERNQQVSFTYIVLCSDNTYYTGWTKNLEERINTHNKGRGAKYTKARLPIKLVYFEVHPDKVSAMKREAAIKKMSRNEKIKLINASN